jgi:hypothetical protein
VARIIPSQNSRILEVNLPIRITWYKDGTFKDVDAVMPKNVSRYQKGLVKELLADIAVVYTSLDDYYQEISKTPMPDSVLKAFKDDEEPV